MCSYCVELWLERIKAGQSWTDVAKFCLERNKLIGAGQGKPSLVSEGSELIVAGQKRSESV